MSCIMDNPVIITATATIVASSISSLVAYLVACRSKKYSEISRIDEQILKFNTIAVEYPYLEDDDFCKGWIERSKQDERYMRYDNYCCIVFNLIETLWEHFNGDKKKIDNYLGVKELALRHRQWWESEVQNEEGYSKKFRTFIDNYIEGESQNN